MGATGLSSQGSADVALALELLDVDVRGEIRRRGVDPLTDVESVRALARSAVRAHDQRSLTGIVRPVDDPDRAVDELVARVAGFGPLQAYLDDPAVEEIWINEPHRVFVARDGRHELTTTILTADEVRDLVERMLKTSGRRLDLSSPFVDAMLLSGHRLHVVLEGIARGFAAVNIREDVVLEENGTERIAVGRPAGDRLRAAVEDLMLGI
ncbi:MAG: pilus assembly protein CpaF [Nocardioidaceae bacterium]|jgi:pilus assembly protein CpaF|nr:pilus assembly protein CpaF [Nocardioidaceae bacterium]